MSEFTLICCYSTIEDMRYLVRKYPNGYEGTETRRAERESTQLEVPDPSFFDQEEHHLVLT